MSTIPEKIKQRVPCALKHEELCQDDETLQIIHCMMEDYDVNISYDQERPSIVVYGWENNVMEALAALSEQVKKWEKVAVTPKPPPQPVINSTTTAPKMLPIANYRQSTMKKTNAEPAKNTNPVPATKYCVGCDKILPNDRFSQAQRKHEDDTRRCLKCVEHDLEIWVDWDKGGAAGANGAKPERVADTSEVRIRQTTLPANGITLLQNTMTKQDARQNDTAMTNVMKGKLSDRPGNGRSESGGAGGSVNNMLPKSKTGHVSVADGLGNMSKPKNEEIIQIPQATDAAAPPYIWPRRDADSPTTGVPTFIGVILENVGRLTTKETIRSAMDKHGQVTTVVPEKDQSDGICRVKVEFRSYQVAKKVADLESVAIDGVKIAIKPNVPKDYIALSTSNGVRQPAPRYAARPPEPTRTRPQDAPTTMAAQSNSSAAKAGESPPARVIARTFEIDKRVMQSLGEAAVVSHLQKIEKHTSAKFVPDPDTRRLLGILAEPGNPQSAETAYQRLEAWHTLQVKAVTRNSPNRVVHQPALAPSNDASSNQAGKKPDVLPEDKLLLQRIEIRPTVESAVGVASPAKAAEPTASLERETDESFGTVVPAQGGSGSSCQQNRFVSSLREIEETKPKIVDKGKGPALAPFNGPAAMVFTDPNMIEAIQNIWPNQWGYLSVGVGERMRRRTGAQDLRVKYRRDGTFNIFSQQPEAAEATAKVIEEAYNIILVRLEDLQNEKQATVPTEDLDLTEEELTQMAINESLALNDNDINEEAGEAGPSSSSNATTTEQAIRQNQKDALATITNGHVQNQVNDIRTEEQAKKNSPVPVLQSTSVATFMDGLLTKDKTQPPPAGTQQKPTSSDAGTKTITVSCQKLSAVTGPISGTGDVPRGKHTAIKATGISASTVSAGTAVTGVPIVLINTESPVTTPASTTITPPATPYIDGSINTPGFKEQMQTLSTVRVFTQDERSRIVCLPMELANIPRTMLAGLDRDMRDIAGRAGVGITWLDRKRILFQGPTKQLLEDTIKQIEDHLATIWMPQTAAAAESSVTIRPNGTPATSMPSPQIGHSQYHLPMEPHSWPVSPYPSYYQHPYAAAPPTAYYPPPPASPWCPPYGQPAYQAARPAPTAYVHPGYPPAGAASPAYRPNPFATPTHGRWYGQGYPAPSRGMM